MHNLPEDFNFQQHSSENFKYYKRDKVSVMTRKRVDVLMSEEGREIVEIIVKKAILP
jgi:hypothetical protein